MIKPSHFLLLMIALTLSSCQSYKKIPYFQNLDRSKGLKEAIVNFSPLIVQSEDILAINVSSLNPEASSVFNYNLATVTGSLYTTAENPVIGYLVDKNGNIQLPLVGAFKVAGLSTDQISKELSLQLFKYLKDPVVNIRILNFKVSVLGDVGRPGVFSIQNERVTLPEALSMAGDLNISAIRTNVLLIRERNGFREYIDIDLTSKDLFNSPHYYLKSNDVIYIQPDKSKYATVDRTYRNLSLLLTALSVIALVITR